MPEVNGQHTLSKLFYFFNNESLTISCPTYDITEFIILNGLKSTSNI